MHFNLGWSSLLGSSCTFSSDVFLDVMDNLVKNPNITSSHVFRADILYDSSVNDISLLEEEHSPTRSTDYLSKFARCMKPEYQPRKAKNLPAAFRWQRTIVRQIVPRNPQLDRPLVQTCHFLISNASDAVDEKDIERKRADETLIVLIPHADAAEDVPWYHPKVEALAFLHSKTFDLSCAEASSPAGRSPAPADFCKAETCSVFSPLPSSAFPASQLAPPEVPGGCAVGSLSLHARPFAHTSVDERVRRTALKLLRTIHKHGHGLEAGYVKRGLHDQLVPQRRFQDTYVRLKMRYSRDLLAKWVEQTDPTKHVFEDLGIAAFLIEMWRDMYGVVPFCEQDGAELHTSEASTDANASKFPGFVDIGCGNGVLVYILSQEGYHGWGFDARKRKTWDTFPKHIRTTLREMALVPWLLQEAIGTLSRPIEVKKHENDLDPKGFTISENLRGTAKTGDVDSENTPLHDGNFRQGTFIISNHADELTAWTPLIALLSESPFIIIPCCSHNLAGNRFRASVKSPTQMRKRDHSGCSEDPITSGFVRHKQDGRLLTKQSETSDLMDGGKMEKECNPKSVGPPSAYASLCNYVINLASDLGFVPEREMLRIPSTRNAAIVSRQLLPSPQFSYDSESADLISGTPREIVGDYIKQGSITEPHGAGGDFAARVKAVRAVLERELGDAVALRKASEDWLAKVRSLRKTDAGKTH